MKIRVIRSFTSLCFMSKHDFPFIVIVSMLNYVLDIVKTMSFRTEFHVEKNCLVITTKRLCYAQASNTRLHQWEW
jgi:hypothetical protein